MMKSQAIPLCPAREANRPFVQCICPLVTLVTLRAMEPQVDCRGFTVLVFQAPLFCPITVPSARAVRLAIRARHREAAKGSFQLEGRGSRLNEERKTSCAEVARNTSSILAVVEQEKDRHATFAVTLRTAKGRATACDKCLAKMETALNFIAGADVWDKPAHVHGSGLSVVSGILRGCASWNTSPEDYRGLLHLDYPVQCTHYVNSCYTVLFRR